MKNDLILGQCAPEAVGLSSHQVEACLRALDATENELHGIVMERHGRIFCETYLAPYSGQMPHTNHSLGKSYTCTGFGLACAQGLLSEEERFTDVFAEEFERYGIVPDEKMKRLKMRHLMSMSVGMARMPEMDERWLERFLREPIVHEPGEQFLYNSVGSCLLGAAVEKRSGEPLDVYMRKRLFDRIGIAPQEHVWRKFNGVYVAEPGTSATTRANLRLGMFYAAYGFADGQQLISRSWMEQAMTKQVETSSTPGTDDSAMGYGWQLWMCKQPGMVRFDGGQGQLCLIWPRQDMVVAVHQAGRYPHGVPKVMELLESLMASAAPEPLPPDNAACESLRQYERSRCVPPAPAALLPEDADSWEGDYFVTDGIFQPWIEVAPVQEDFYHLFYAPHRNAQVRFLRLTRQGGDLVLTLDGIAELRASLNGMWTPRKTASVLEDLPDYAATARFLDRRTLRISLRWLNSWCCPEITLTRLGQGRLGILVQKDMLADGRELFTHAATAVRIR